MKYPIIVVRCLGCTYVASARHDDSAKAAFVDHLEYAHQPGVEKREAAS